MDSNSAAIKNHPGFIAFKAKPHSSSDMEVANQAKVKQELAADKQNESK